MLPNTRFCHHGVAFFLQFHNSDGCKRNTLQTLRTLALKIANLAPRVPNFAKTKCICTPQTNRRCTHFPHTTCQFCNVICPVAILPNATHHKRNQLLNFCHHGVAFLQLRTTSPPQRRCKCCCTHNAICATRGADLHNCATTRILQLHYQYNFYNPTTNTIFTTLPQLQFCNPTTIAILQPRHSHNNFATKKTSLENQRGFVFCVCQGQSTI